MKKLLLVTVLIALVGCSSIPKSTGHDEPQTPPAAQAQAAAPTLAGEAYTGAIAGYRMGGSMAKPYIHAQIKGEDGKVVEFNLRKTTAVTDPAGNTIGFMKRFKAGRRVEIKFEVKDGKNEAVAWHYLD